jgi:sugar phosphate isomerase/epimerase
MPLRFRGDRRKCEVQGAKFKAVPEHEGGNMLTRRNFGKLALASLVMPRGLALGGQTSRIAGVRVGVQTYSFRELPRPAGADSVDTIVRAMKDCGLVECELWSPQIEPQQAGGRGRPPEEVQKARDDLRAWRMNTPLEHFKGIRKTFAAAGLSIYAYNYSPNSSFTDGEIDRGFEMAKALGAEIITSSTTIDVARRIVPFAERHRMVVAMHGHSDTSKPGEFASPESFAEAMRMSPYFKVNLDIGHFTAANFDAMQYMREHHDVITNLHLKDRKSHQGDNVPWGTGDTPIRDVLQLLKRERWPIRAYIEYEHRGSGTPVEEVKKCYAFVREALA